MLDDYDLVDNKKTNARIAICQISLSAEQIAFSGQQLEEQIVHSIWSRIKRTLLEVLPEKPDAIFFPECSIPKELIQNLEDFSNKYDIIIIAGTHYNKIKEGYISSCPVIFPNKGCVLTDKFTISPLEKKPIHGESVISGEQRYFFKNTKIGNFLIYICSDFLSNDTINEIASFDPDIVFVPSCQKLPEKHYYNELNSACGAGVSGCYCLFSNLKSPNLSDGKSAVFGITDDAYHSSYSESELTDLIPKTKIWQAKSDNDYVVVELDLELKKPEVPKRIQTSPNINIIADRSRLKRENNNRKAKDYKLIAFDMDGTLLRGIVFSWVKLWELCGDDGTLWRKYLSQYRSGELEYEKWCEIAVDYYKRAELTQELIYDVAGSEAYIVDGLVDGLLELKELGFKTALISGGVDIFMMALIPNYKELFDDIFINQLHFDGEGIVCGVKATKFDYVGKAKAIELVCENYGFDIDETIYVGDTYNDDAALKLSGHGIVFGKSEDGVKHLANKYIEGENFYELIDYIKDIYQPSLK